MLTKRPSAISTVALAAALFMAVAEPARAFQAGGIRAIHWSSRQAR